MKVIASSDNKTFKFIKSLEQKKYRDRTLCCLVEGEKLVTEALALGLCETVVLREGYEKEIPKGDAEFLFMEGKLFEKLALTENSQGILAVVKKPVMEEAAFFEAVGEKNILVIDQVQDPGNIGTMIRTAFAAGYGGAVVMKGSGDVFGPKAVRAAAGSVLRLPLLATEDIPATVEGLKTAGKRIVATGPREAKDYREVDFSADVALVIGNEGNGVRQELLETADVNVSIPMREGAESLNAAVAAGILMYAGIK